MPNWLAVFLTVLALSKRTQWAITLGIVFFIGINLLGGYFVGNLSLEGQFVGIENIIRDKLLKRYDKFALVALVSFWIVAYKCYQKDKKRFW